MRTTTERTHSRICSTSNKILAMDCICGHTNYVLRQFVRSVYGRFAKALQSHLVPYSDQVVVSAKPCKNASLGGPVDPHEATIQIEDRECRNAGRRRSGDLRHTVCANRLRTMCKIPTGSHRPTLAEGCPICEARQE